MIVAQKDIWCGNFWVWYWGRGFYERTWGNKGGPRN